MTTRAEFEQILADVTSEFVCDNPSDINRGECGNWAASVQEDVPGVELWEFDEDRTGMEPEHVFVRFRGRYYDAETPRGVKDWRDLPLFQFYRRNYSVDYSGVEPTRVASVRDTGYSMHRMAEEKNWTIDPTKGAYMWRRSDG